MAALPRRSRALRLAPGACSLPSGRRILVPLVLCGPLLASAPPSAAQDGALTPAPRAVTALRIAEPIRVDGQLSEPAWGRAEAATGFYRAQQARGVPAALRTEAWVLHDERRV
ncbi:MAG: hypothetical protein AB1505_04070 [Candidatus Latescibacterota bacterium]